MNFKAFIALIVILLGMALLPCLGSGYAVMVFSKTAGFRHDSIPAGIAAIQQLGASNNFSVTATEDASVFTDAGLAPYQVVVFLNTSGDVLNQAQQDAFTRYIQAGRGYVGVHAASDTELTWAWYGALVGAYFTDHPAIQTATVRVEDTNNISTRFLPAAWVRTDEWYNLKPNPRTNDASIHVLARVDESTYSGGTMGTDHPISWYHAYDGGRSWYTAMGHATNHYSEPLFRGHLLGGIQYAAGAAASPAPTLTGLAVDGDGAFRFTFANPSSTQFNVFATDDLAVAPIDWVNLGPATQISNGVYGFTDTGAGNYSQRFYQLRSP
ncbi:MAG: ThuA domain-containing protein [Verrucomicrobia bacterium]|nr:ThuA domain-containing protein [Verrucomicrobiota bacterium]